MTFRLDSDYITVVILLYHVILGYTEYLIQVSSEPTPGHRRDLGLYTYIFQDQKEKLLLGNCRKVLEYVSKPTVHETIKKPSFFLEKYIEDKISHRLWLVFFPPILN